MRQIKNMCKYSVFCLIIAVTSTGVLSCNYPKHLWCSSRRIATECEVVHLCDTAEWSSPSNQYAPPVQFSLYLESLCPDCKYFIKEQLWPTFLKIGQIMNISLIPYGNAMEVRDDDLWKFTCQHGEEECKGNLIETCAIHLHPEQNVFMPFIACIELSTDIPSNVAKMCAGKYNISYAAIEACASSRQGNRLEHLMAELTDNLNPPHTYVPWVTLNGVHTDSIQEAAQADLLGLICKTYKGQPPAACQKQVIPQGKL